MRTVSALLCILSVSVVMAQTPVRLRTADNSDNDYHAGFNAATSDIKRGVVRYVTIGGPLSAGWGQRVRWAKEHYHVELVWSGSCMAPPYQYGYSDAVIHYLIRKYGYDPIFGAKPTRE